MTASAMLAVFADSALLMFVHISFNSGSFALSICMSVSTFSGLISNSRAVLIAVSSSICLFSVLYLEIADLPIPSSWAAL